MADLGCGVSTLLVRFVQKATIAGRQEFFFFFFARARVATQLGVLNLGLKWLARSDNWRVNLGQQPGRTGSGSA